MSRAFTLSSAYSPAGDQPKAIRTLVDGLENGLAYQTLLGVTGSGKLSPWLMSYLRYSAQP